jgi:Fe2+ or Zn2+ uptake regulation protein
MQNSKIINQLKQQGCRITKVRKLIVQTFQQRRLPITELEIRNALRHKGTTANKTTIYRELGVLKKLRLINEVEFGDGKKRYELDRDHHHHLICIGCKKIGEIRASSDVAHMEQQIKKQKCFMVTSHALEFFGLCQKCSGNN